MPFKITKNLELKMEIQPGLTTQLSQLKYFPFLRSKLFVKNYSFYWIAALIYCLFFIVSLFTFNKATDETIYHYPNILNFYNNGLSAIFNSHYSSANTPLPYYLVALIGKIIGPGIVQARIFTGIISFSSFILASRLLKRKATPQYTALIILFFPYFFVNSFIFYVINYAIFFLLISLNILYYTKDSDSIWSNLIVGLFISMAVLCQQFYLVIPIAIIAARIITIVKNKNNRDYGLFKKLIVNNLFLITPLTIPFIIFFKWHGITHPNFYKHTLSFYPGTIVAVLVVTGLYFIPVIIQSFKLINWFNGIVTLAMATALVLLFRPLFADTQGPGLFTGVTFHILYLSGNVIKAFPVIGMISLAWLGILALFIIYRSLRSFYEYALFFSCTLLAIVYSLNTLIGERHFIGFFVILLLLVLPKIHKKILLPYTVLISLAGISYYIFFFFLKFN